MRLEQKQSCHSAAIIFIGTGKYIDYFPKYYATSKKLFLPKTPKVYIVLTDKTDSPLLEGKADVTPVNIKASQWPFPTLLRYHYIANASEQFKKHSHLIFMDADMYAFSLITEEEFFLHDRPLFGVQHPGFIGKKGSFESNPASTACVSKTDDLGTYWQGCFWGGLTNEVLTLCKELARRIDDDLSRNVIAIWHDESHLNKYFIERKNMVHTYHPGYSFPETLWDKLAYEKKIVHLLKDHKERRSI